MNAPKRKTVGLALSGGGARGPAHLGALRVLEREKIPIDVVAGVSAGSIVGALYCAGVTLQDMLYAIGDFNWLKIAGLAVPRYGLFSFEKLDGFLAQWIGEAWFSELQKPFAVGTTDLLTGRSIIFTTGRVATLVRASCSIPGLVVPLKYGDYWLVDGGISCNLPSHAARALGAELVIGVDLLKPYVRKKFGALGIGTTAVEIMIRHSGGGLDGADVALSPALDNKTYSRFSRAQEMIALGEEAMEKALPLIRTALGAAAPAAA